MSDEQSKFSGWAIVEIMGHSKEIGFVTTEYFGQLPKFHGECVRDSSHWSGSGICKSCANLRYAVRVARKKGGS